MKQIFSMKVNNRPGVLVRVTRLFFRRRCHIVSMTVNPVEDGERSEMMIEAEGSADALDQVEKQVHKLIDVLQVEKSEVGAKERKQTPDGKREADHDPDVNGAGPTIEAINIRYGIFR